MTRTSSVRHGFDTNVSQPSQSIATHPHEYHRCVDYLLSFSSIEAPMYSSMCLIHRLATASTPSSSPSSSSLRALMIWVMAQHSLASHELHTASHNRTTASFCLALGCASFCSIRLVNSINLVSSCDIRTPTATATHLTAVQTPRQRCTPPTLICVLPPFSAAVPPLLLLVKSCCTSGWLLSMRGIRLSTSRRDTHAGNRDDTNTSEVLSLGRFLTDVAIASRHGSATSAQYHVRHLSSLSASLSCPTHMSAIVAPFGLAPD
mmetsp:Transcript_6551/g.15843  ORF Transcript_6551/g.15843 Transcript_6551/m.15843 type:complete len:262 (-) Transcript_6551:343-1128(-)